MFLNIGSAKRGYHVDDQPKKQIFASQHNPLQKNYCK